MRTLVLSSTGVLVIALALLWRSAWLHQARHRDAARIRPARVIPGCEKANESLPAEARQKREREAKAIADFTLHLRAGKHPRLYRVS